MTASRLSARVGVEVAGCERNVGADRKGDRPDVLGRRPDMNPHSRPAPIADPEEFEARVVAWMPEYYHCLTAYASQLCQPVLHQTGADTLALPVGGSRNGRAKSDGRGPIEAASNPVPPAASPTPTRLSARR